MNEIADYFDVHYSTVSRAVKMHDCKTWPCFLLLAVYGYVMHKTNLSKG